MKIVKCWFCAALLALLPVASFAQDEAAIKKLQALDWKLYPSQGSISGKATIKLDGGLRFLDADNTNQFLTLQGNLPTTNTFAVTANDLRWFSVFSFVEEGLVPDCPRRLNIDPPCRFNIDPGRIAAF